LRPWTGGLETGGEEGLAQTKEHPRKELKDLLGKI